MSAQYQGSLTLGQCLPTSLEAAAALDAAINLTLPDLQARLAGALNLQVALTIQLPTLQATLDASIALVAQLQASLALTAPSISLQLSAVLTLIAQLELFVGQLEGYLALAISLQATLGAAGVHLYTYSGRADALGPSLAGILGAGPPGSSPSDATGGILMAATAPAAIAALGAAIGRSL